MSKSKKKWFESYVNDLELCLESLRKVVGSMTTIRQASELEEQIEILKKDFNAAKFKNGTASVSSIVTLAESSKGVKKSNSVSTKYLVIPKLKFSSGLRLPHASYAPVIGIDVLRRKNLLKVGDVHEFFSHQPGSRVGTTIITKLTAIN